MKNKHFGNWFNFYSLLEEIIKYSSCVGFVGAASLDLCTQLVSKVGASKYPLHLATKMGRISEM